ncbi:hypothetical protein [Pseudobacillus wudalianchiensis]|uniref:HTH merR-type domain-containing protein n=1 Tax=Pseudobacillus wudalianchiensis TaxID=1743143 RepID=A0A1B9AAQ9_9BACI|nr:hypothetical protein [Bacillus wudalianchiensis]OCA80928.1 hypothetical protein A8F95_17650 [Bacillus wudalianchiensis]
MEQAYFSSEVAKSLGVGASTLRKYSSALEAAGYRFDRGLNNSRVFYQKDIIAVQRLLKLIQEQNMTLEAAIELAMKMEPEKKEEPVKPIQAPVENHELYERIARLEQQQETLIAVNKELVKELAQHQRWMQEKLEHQEIAIRDRLLLNSLQPPAIKREPPKYRIPSLFSFFRGKKNEATFN